MLKQLYAIKDTKSAFQPPFECVNNLVAIRQCKLLLKQKNLFSANPEDFELWHVGTFDDITGELVSAPDHIVNFIDIVPDEEKNI